MNTATASFELKILKARGQVGITLLECAPFWPQANEGWRISFLPMISLYHDGQNIGLDLIWFGFQVYAYVGRR